MEARNEYRLSTMKVDISIDTLNTVVSEINEDIYSGEDGDSFRVETTEFIDKDVKNLQISLAQMAVALNGGLNDARGCKKICNDFIISLGGEGNGKTEADMQGELYCDQAVINELKGYCRSALSYTDPIRTICTNIEDTLLGLQMVKLNPTPYTCAIREGCDKVDKLEDHSRELDTYASTVETIDGSFADALAGCVPDDESESESVLGARRSNEQIETIMRIMKKKGELSEYDRNILNEQLRSMEENGDIEELQKLADYTGNGENGAWSKCDAYVMAHIYNYAENNANAEMATVVYNQMKKPEYITWGELGAGESVEFVSIYEVKLDEEKVSAILGELDPDTDGLAYYSLQRRRKYTQRVKVPVSKTSEESAKESFEINFETKDGKLVSVFTVDGKTERLASVDMNEVVGQEWEKSPMFKKGFSKEERIGLLSSIYTDEDISFIGNLARAESQSDYRDLFLQHDPDDLGDAAMASLYQYSFALANHNITYNDKFDIDKQNFYPLQEFVNGLLETDISVASDIEVYLNNLADQSSLQLDITAWAISNNYDNKDMVNMLIPGFELNAELYGLYISLLNRRENYVNYSVDNIGNCIQISELGFGLAGNKEIDGKKTNIKNITSSNLCFNEKVMYYDEMKVLQEAPPVSGGLDREIVLSSGNEQIKKDANKLIDLQKEKQKVIPKSILKTSIAVASVYNPWIGVAAGVVESVATLESGTARSTVKKVLEKLNSQYLKDNEKAKKEVEAGITILDGVADTIISYRQVDKEIEKILDSMKVSMFGDFIIMEDAIIAEGVYSANTLLRRLELEKNGLSFLADPKMKDAVKNELLNPSETSQSVLEELTKEKSYDKAEAISALYLIWTGKPYVDKNGKVSELDNIRKLSINDIRVYMDELNVIAKSIGESSKTVPYDKIDAEAFINHNYLKQQEGLYE